ncbi:M23 family metallopeptidase [Nesterenkonia lutea]|uniref:M23ase beta-sheet core domain-containing protein n=1 Tax=Nesterenkonia lutea TaxID=272919 RepID=A0ABR9JFJ5_9MICC|nr:M23 family metallopeptidase [Nesterenkonia lutea]MBE1524705.1 hypothetical protein [Nesterenkonia lutea]
MSASTRLRALVPQGHQGTESNRTTPSIDVQYPFVGRWLAQNSPANRVPSHGTSLFATSYAIDFVPVDDSGHTAPMTFGAFLRPESPVRFTGFGRTLLAPVEGIVVTAHDTELDHPAYRGLPSISYALTQQRRVRAGWVALAGNHVLIESEGVIVALCHLQQDSVQVRPGQLVAVGDVLGRCGNSGNRTEPHVHLQAIDHRDVACANAVRMTIEGSIPRNGRIVNIGPRR